MLFVNNYQSLFSHQTILSCLSPKWEVRQSNLLEKSEISDNLIAHIFYNIIISLIAVNQTSNKNITG